MVVIDKKLFDAIKNLNEWNRTVGFTRSIKIWDKTPKILEKYELYYHDIKIYMIIKIKDQIIDRLNSCLVILICDNESPIWKPQKTASTSITILSEYVILFTAVFSDNELKTYQNMYFYSKMIMIYTK